MYKKILVPLDGSGFAECSLEHVKAVTSGSSASKIILFSVVEPLSTETVYALTIAGDDLLRKAEMDNQTEARNYIGKVKNKLAKSGLKVETVVIDGRAAEEILDYTKNNKVELIIMTTHGKSGLRRAIMGSVADAVIRALGKPVLVVHLRKGKK